jgi:hypothetical protein
MRWRTLHEPSNAKARIEGVQLVPSIARALRDRFARLDCIVKQAVIGSTLLRVQTAGRVASRSEAFSESAKLLSYDLRLALP